MKAPIALLTMLAGIVTVGCQKHDDHPTSPSSPKIVYISTLGSITYQGAKLNTIGDYHLLYDDNQKLTGLRLEDSVSHSSLDPTNPDPFIAKTLIKYSFIWKEGKIAASKLDTLMTTVIQGGHLFSSNSLTDSPYGVYFSSGERLDSILFIVYTDQNHLKKIIYEYGPDGNVSKETDFYFPTVSYPMPLTPAKTISTFKYDHHPNPWNLLVKHAGVVLPSVFEGHSISKNNLIEADIEAIFPGDTIDIRVSKIYTYNSSGYPVEEIIPGFKPDTIFYQYQ